MLINALRSPGYMLTKLTKTILAHDQELKVSRSRSRPRAPLECRFLENMGEPDADGTGMSSG